MIRGYRQVFGRAVCLLAVVGLLAIAGPGCDDSAQKKNVVPGEIPATVKESNKNMEDFMKSQKK